MQNVLVSCDPVSLSFYNLVVAIKEPLFSVNDIEGVFVALLSTGDLSTELVVLLYQFILWRSTNRSVEISNVVAQFRMSYLSLHYLGIWREHLGKFLGDYYWR